MVDNKDKNKGKEKEIERLGDIEESLKPDRTDREYLLSDVKTDFIIESINNLVQERKIKRIISIALYVFIPLSYFIQLSLLFDCKKSFPFITMQAFTEETWKILIVVTASFTFVFVSFIVGAFGSKKSLKVTPESPSDISGS